jgi:hypothetical protein
MVGVLILIHEGTEHCIISHCNIETNSIGHIVSCIKCSWNLVEKIEGFSVQIFIYLILCLL